MKLQRASYRLPLGSGAPHKGRRVTRLFRFAELSLAWPVQKTRRDLRFSADEVLELGPFVLYRSYLFRLHLGVEW